MTDPQISIRTETKITVDGDFIRMAIKQELRARGYEVSDNLHVDYDLSFDDTLVTATITSEKYS